jgi:cell division protein FtsN
MSGQSSFDSGKNSVEIYKENSAKNLTESKKDYVGINKNADPFSNNLKNNQPIIPLENTGSASEFKDYESSEKTPVVEYDFYKEDEKSNNNNLNNKASEAITKNNEDNFQEDRLELGSAPKNAKSSNKKLSNKGSKIITYSNKKNQKNNKLDNSAQSEQEEEVEAESVKEINQDKSGKFYVQIGSFFNSRGAKERLAKNNEFGKGKVLIAYKNNKRIYRSVFGPFKSRKSALKLRDSIIESGNEAVIIKGK